MKRFYVVLLLVLIALSLPVFLWYLEPVKELDIAIIDKTVPDESYREHLGLTWLLNHTKIRKSNGEDYKAESDYYGFRPDEEGKSYDIRSLPEDYSKYDVIYLADTYGVYEGDLPWIEKKREGARSGKIYGGLEEEEWQAITERLNSREKSLLIAEYNTFASPTNAAVRESAEDYLGLEWSGWTGRYFTELNPEKNAEIPQWIIDEFGESWGYSGSGFLLVNDLTSEVIVLEEALHVSQEGISLSFTEEGQEKFGLSTGPKYGYWFDIVEPKGGSAVLANYDLALTAEGEELLKDTGIPLQFAAIIETGHGAASAYYFAGDFNDLKEFPYFHQIKGIQKIYEWTGNKSESAFYWRIYSNVMQTILNEFILEGDAAQPAVPSELQYTARMNQGQIEVKVGGEWKRITIKGVNMGMGKPGHFPGEAAISEDEYYRWFEMIAEMNANTIRIYTLHPPGFYDALKRYNDSHEEKLYLFHGVWINEERLVESMDAFEEENLKDFQNEMHTIVDVIHGNKVVEERPGHSSGVYRSDISEYVIGWILGIEWYPFTVQKTNEQHGDIGDFSGKYFETKNASPFEHWLAMQMETITDYEMEKYHWVRPISFTNWPTTDLLEHPSDSTGIEDIVSVNPNVIYTKNEMGMAGQFASYHIYPYYPDFLNYDRAYQEYIDHRGNRNNYAGYLNQLKDSHRLPILVAEFGVPSSRGKTHENPHGWNQGFLSEEEAGEVISSLFEDIIVQDMLGGLVFTWQDEWFKRTWNTMDYDNPERRPYWSNAQTNEQQFGLLSFDRHKIRVDGRTDEWTNEPLYEGQVIERLQVDHDERYLYLRMDYDSGKGAYPVLLLDVVPGQGNHFIGGLPEVGFNNGIDFVVNLQENESRIMIDEYYDFFTFQYGNQLRMIPQGQVPPEKNSGRFIPMNYVLNRELYLPDRDKTLPFSSYETGKLLKGNGNPDSKDYHSLADYTIKDGVLELRIPWLLIQAKDPSRKEFIGDLYSDGTSASVHVDEIYIGALLLGDGGQIIESLPSLTDEEMSDLNGYTWENWQEPKYEERLKQSYYIIQDLFSGYE